VALRALVAAHALSAWNRSSRRLSRAGRTVSLVILGFSWLAACSSFGLAAAGLGWAAASDWEKRGSLGDWSLFALSWGLGILFGLTGGGRLLEAGQLRQFPVRPLTLVLAELAARLFEPLTATIAVALAALHVGLFFARPELFPALALLFPLHLFILLALQFILSELVGALARRLRVGVGIVVLVSMALSPRAAGLFGRTGLDLTRFDRLQALAPYLPTHWLLDAADRATRDVWDGIGLLILQGLLGPAVLLLLGLWVMGREQSARAQEASEQEKKLWTFATPAGGVARMHLATMFRTPAGRYSLIAPLFAMLLMPGLSHYLFGVQRAALAVFIYAALGTVQFHFNLLGFDGPSVGELFRLPLTSRALLWGKHVATMALALVEGAVLVGFLRFFREEPLDSCLTGLCLFVTINLLMGALGRFISVQWPRSLPKRGTRGVAAPLPVVLINLFGSVLIGGGMGLLHWVFQHAFGAWAVLWALGLLGVSLAVSWFSLPAASRFLDARREAVLLAMR
jgi:hypothetical protein